jgi:hypothetical protein
MQNYTLIPGVWHKEKEGREHQKRRLKNVINLQQNPKKPTIILSLLSETYNRKQKIGERQSGN